MLRRAAVALLIAGCGGAIDTTDDHATATRQIGTERGNGSSPTVAPAPLPLPITPTPAACGAVSPFDADFAHLEDGFTVSDRAAFSVDNGSLRVQPTTTSYLTHAVGAACQMTVKFRIRATDDLLKSGSNLLRVVTDSHRFTLTLNGGGNGFTVAQEEEPGGIGYLAPFGSLGTAATTITMTVNLTKGTLLVEGTDDSDAGTGWTSGSMPILRARQSSEGITAVDLGTTPGIQSNPNGVYWIDGFSIH